MSDEYGPWEFELECPVDAGHKSFVRRKDHRDSLRELLDRSEGGRALLAARETLTAADVRRLVALPGVTVSVEPGEFTRLVFTIDGVEVALLTGERFDADGMESVALESSERDGLTVADVLTAWGVG